MRNTTGIDFIGDIHGHADALEQLLRKMGYTQKENIWNHPGRIAFFAGDFIDRGPKIPETLRIVRHMISSGNARAVMGNHEYNAICFNRKDRKGRFLREHSQKNRKQHAETISQFRGSQKEYISMIQWFETLPLFHESDGFRVVHATWDQHYVDHLNHLTGDGVLNDDLIHQSVYEKSRLYQSVDTTLKGKELELPGSSTFQDKDGHERRAVRVKWWEHPDEQTYSSLAVGNIESLPDIPVQKENSFPYQVYERDERPVFFGHYWLKGEPRLFRENICCLDYSVAKGGKLVAYRFDGEERLLNEKLVSV